MRQDHGLIADGDELRGATCGGYPLKVYDDGFGPLFAYRETFGVIGIVRAQTWHDALEIVYDDILTPIPVEELPEAYGFDSQAELDKAAETARETGDYPDLIEGYQYQANSTDTGIVALDDNESLDELNQKRLDDWGIVLDIVKAEEEDDD